ncbi:FkbM family methyltransferase [Rhodoferax sp.]|uniref:FkbM family methyltransferase n=1 Tax=Rhodoferax sp. TaxID=50421 RepID=UPI002622A166|nr:FkbM family methyltransferase [Rhodoferax sp.]MDD3935650.1 FkbM family methyltransferase [Rhodoferax sp.]
MSFVSYAQNYEDVMLWRSLKHVKNGFYIDVGAAWPDEHSITKAFYENGWQGINIEPNPVHHASLVQQRPRDSNLQMAVGDHVGRLTMNFVGDTGLSTAIDAFAEQHQSAGWTSNRQEVELTTLQAICRKHIKLDQPIHFLKVDVEGLEEATLRGNDWAAYRPWVVVVEATLPMTQAESYEGWEPILLKAGYAFAYADGLNRFYVANEHAELLQAFKYPPNVFDSFLLKSQQEAEAKAYQASERAVLAEAQAQQASERAASAEAQAQQASARAALAESQAQQASARAASAESQAQQASARAASAESQAQQASARAALAEAQAQQAETKTEHAVAQAQQATVKAQQAEEQLDAVYASTSWRITAPLRKFMNFLKAGHRS